MDVPPMMAIELSGGPKDGETHLIPGDTNTLCLRTSPDYWATYTRTERIGPSGHLVFDFQRVELWYAP